MVAERIIIERKFAGASLEDLHAMLSAQGEEELALFHTPQLLNHFATNRDTISALLNFWSRSEDIIVICAKLGPDYVAYLTIQRKPDFFNNREIVSGEIVALYVDRRFRRKGLARALMIEAEGYFKEKGVEVVNTSWLEGNAASKALYEAMGYQVVTVNARKRL